jgi:hypothetical protein
MPEEFEYYELHYSETDGGKYIEGRLINEEESYYVTIFQSLDSANVDRKFKISTNALSYPEKILDLSATCYEGWWQETMKSAVCSKNDEFVITVMSDKFSNPKSVMKQIINKIDDNSSLPKGGGCLIATATYGSEMSNEVQQLRELRDNQLLNTASGTQFMSTFNDIYYSFSPTIADYERENPLFKEVVKIAITPMISSLSLMENAESESEVISLGLSVIMLNIGMYLGVPAVVIVGIRKRI